MKKKILYISPNGYLGGAEKFVITATEGHKRLNKIDSAILFFNSGEASLEAGEKQILNFTLKNKFRMRNPISFVKALLEIRKIIIKYDPDIIHSTMPYAHIASSLATIGLKVKKIWFQHGPVGGKLDFIANFFKVNAILYNSHYLKMQHHKMLPPPRVTNQEIVLNLGVPQFNFPPKNIFAKKIIFGSAGRITEWKGFHISIQALLEISQQENDSFIFYVAGTAKTPTDKIYEQSLRQMVIDSKLSEKVIFLGHQKDLSQFYQMIDVFIHCSTIPEPFGLVVAEAMSAGCLIIGSNAGGVKDILIENKTGLSFSSTTKLAVDELKIKIKQVLIESQQSPALEQLAKNGRIFINENYSIDKMINKLEDIYINL